MHDGYDGFAGSPETDELIAALVEAPFRFVRWVWRQLRGR